MRRSFFRRALLCLAAGIMLMVPVGGCLDNTIQRILVAGLI